MHQEFASVRGIVDLSPPDVIERAQTFLTSQGYSVVHRTTTTLTVERQNQGGAAEQEVLRVVITTIPQREGGVQVKVGGTDRKGIMERQPQWLEWSESLPKQSGNSHVELAHPAGEVGAKAEVEDVLAEANGVDGQVQLLQDRIGIRRGGYFGGGKESTKRLR